jgi:hypothetical protein
MSDADYESLRDEVVGLAQITLRRLKMDIEYGSITQRNAAIRLVAPYLLKVLDKTDEDDQLKTIRDAVDGLMGELRGAGQSE